MVAEGLECSVLSPILNEPWGPDGPLMWPGDRMSLALGLGSPQTPVLRCQTPWEGHICCRTMVSVSPQEAHRHEMMAVVHAEWQGEMMLGMGSVGPKVLSRGVFEYCLVLTIPCPFSHPV